MGEQQQNVVNRLSETVSTLQEKGASESQIVQAISEKLNDCQPVTAIAIGASLRRPLKHTQKGHQILFLFRRQLSS